MPLLQAAGLAKGVDLGVSLSVLFGAAFGGRVTQKEVPSGCRWRPAGTSDLKANQWKRRPQVTTRLSTAVITFLAMLLACGTPPPCDYAAEIEGMAH